MTNSLWLKLKKSIDQAKLEKKKALDKLATVRKKISNKKTQNSKEYELPDIEFAFPKRGMYKDYVPDDKHPVESGKTFSRTARVDRSGDPWADFAQSYRENVSKGCSPVARYKCSFCGAISNYPGCNNCKPTMEQKRKRRMIQIFTAGGEVNTRPYR